jgi:hypothetical protein
MPKKLTKEELNTSIERAKTDIRQGENLIKQMRRELSKAERKARTNRLIQRGAIAESLFRDANEFTNEQLKSILSAGLQTAAAREAVERFRKANAENVSGATPDTR